MLVNPCASVSWISRASLSRSAAAPASRERRALSARVAASSATRAASLSRCRHRRHDHDADDRRRDHADERNGHRQRQIGPAGPVEQQGEAKRHDVHHRRHHERGRRAATSRRPEDRSPGPPRPPPRTPTARRPTARSLRRETAAVRQSNSPARMTRRPNAKTHTTMPANAVDGHRHVPWETVVEHHDPYSGCGAHAHDVRRPTASASRRPAARRLIGRC